MRAHTQIFREVREEGGGRHVWRFGARTALPQHTHTQPKTRAGGARRGREPTYSRDADWLRARSICTRDLTCLQ